MKLVGEIDLTRSSGEIDLPRMKSEAAERQRFVARRARNAEWHALKDWWGANRRLKAAEKRGNQTKIRKARHDLIRTMEVWGPTLSRARSKWRGVQHELRRRGYHRLD